VMPLSGRFADGGGLYLGKDIIKSKGGGEPGSSGYIGQRPADC